MTTFLSLDDTTLRQASCTRRPGAKRTVARWLGRALPVWRRAPSSSPLPTPTLRSRRCYYPCSVNQPCARLETSNDSGEQTLNGHFILDVGVIKDLGTHDIDLTAWVTQQSFSSIAARTAFKSGREHEDLVSITGQLAAAAALILVPSAAMAYEAPGFNFTVSDPTPTVGTPFTATISGADANTVVTLTVECPNVGVKTLTGTANASGVASFSVTLTGAGTCTLTATNAAGAVVATQTVLGVSANAPIPAVGAVGGALPRTGFDPRGVLVGGGLLVLAGAGGVLVARRRKSSRAAA
jgi:LPXTG-motif cell wall-anchored protein